MIYKDYEQYMSLSYTFVLNTKRPTALAHILKFMFFLKLLQSGFILASGGTTSCHVMYKANHPPWTPV